MIHPLIKLHSIKSRGNVKNGNNNSHRLGNIELVSGMEIKNLHLVSINPT